MDKQLKLIRPKQDNSVFEGIEPEIKVIKNTFLTAGALIRELVIKKTWIVPTKK